jgi:predicted nuclease with TOPRIM domain
MSDEKKRKRDIFLKWLKITSPSSNNSKLKEAIKEAKQHLKNVNNSKTEIEKYQECQNVQVVLSRIEKLFDRSNSKHLSQRKEIANIYHDLGTLLDQLKYHDESSECRIKATEWRSNNIVAIQTTRITQTTETIQSGVSSRSSATTHGAKEINDAVANLIISANPTIDTPHTSSSSDTNNVIDKPSRNEIIKTETAKSYFTESDSLTTIKFDLPTEVSGITTTLQLAYCLGLINGVFSEDQLTESQREWLNSRDDDDPEQLNTIAEYIVTEFIQDELKDPEIISEVTSLTAVLSKTRFKSLLDEFINKIYHSVLLKEDILVGLGGLIRNAPLGYLDPDDLVQILDLLHTRLKQTHQQSTGHTFKLIMATSYILDSMVDCEIKDLGREQLHEPLSNYLK